MSEHIYKPGDTVIVHVYENVVHAVERVLQHSDFDTDGTLDFDAIETAVVDNLDWNNSEIQEREIDVEPATKESKHG